jgi:hypothetical protein
MAYNKKQHLADNIEALRIAFTQKPEDIIFSQRQALKKYSGFGGLKCVLNPAQTDGDIDK